MRCRKILTALVVIAMVAATMIVFNFELTKNAMAVQGTPGYNYWMGTHDDVIEIINKTDGSRTDVTSRLYYGNTVDIQFNGTVITESNYLYYPNYNTVYDQNTGNYEVYVNWSLYSSTGITTSDLTLEDVYLGRSGMWLVIADDAPTLWKVNMSTLKICDPPGSSSIMSHLSFPTGFRMSALENRLSSSKPASKIGFLFFSASLVASIFSLYSKSAKSIPFGKTVVANSPTSVPSSNFFCSILVGLGILCLSFLVIQRNLGHCKPKR